MSNKSDSTNWYPVNMSIVEAGLRVRDDIKTARRRIDDVSGHGNSTSDKINQIYADVAI